MTTSLLDWILDLLRDPEARADFQADPRGFAADHGFENLSASDMNDALYLIADQSVGHQHTGGAGNVHFPPPHHPNHNDDGGDGPTYLNNYISNNYKIVEDHSTNIDDSVHQNIDTGGGDFDQVIDNDPVVASGDGTVAAGHRRPPRTTNRAAENTLHGTDP